MRTPCSLPAGARAAIGLSLALATALVAPARAGVTLFRPLVADPRESQSGWHMATYTEDWRYGTDVTDSTSQGGVVQDREGFLWAVSAGEVFRWQPLQRVAGWRGPWVRYQLGVPGLIVSRFDGTGILLNTDYHYGASFDVLWRGGFEDAIGATSFRRAAVTSRLTVMHHSSHLGDEYIAQGDFGRNQTSPPYQGPQFGHPPVKRMDYAYEDAALTLSVERAAGTHATLRAYAGGAVKIAWPASWHMRGIEPANFRSPAWHGGFEARTAGEAATARPPLPVRLLGKLLRAPDLDGEWLAAVHVRLAKPYNFASADNPAGETEAWTPRLWTASPYGREFRNYAGSWHATLGTVIRRRHTGAAASAPPSGMEWIVALDWYRGYSPDGQFLDQRLRYRPRGYVVPGIIAHF